MTDKLAGSAKAKEKFDMKYHVIIHHWGGGASIMSHRNKTEFCERIAKKHKLDLIKRNLKTNEFKALHLCSAGDLWNFGRLTK